MNTLSSTLDLTIKRYLDKTDQYRIKIENLLSKIQRQYTRKFELEALTFGKPAARGLPKFGRTLTLAKIDYIVGGSWVKCMQSVVFASVRCIGLHTDCT